MLFLMHFLVKEVYIIYDWFIQCKHNANLTEDAIITDDRLFNQDETY